MRWLSSFSVKRAVTVSMIALIVIAFGVFSLERLNVDLYPDMEFPMAMVITNYSGASPEDMETLVSRPLEEAVATVEGVEKVSSESSLGLSLVTVEFGWDQDMDQAETDIRRSIDMIQDALPDDATEPLVFVMDPSMQPVLMMTLEGPYNLEQLRAIADDEVSSRIERIPGVASVTVSGGLEPEVHVDLDPIRLAAFGIDPVAVLGVLYQENLQEPGGDLDLGRLEYSIQSMGKYQSVEEIGEIVVGSRSDGSNSKVIQLKDVAQVSMAVQEETQITEVDGQAMVQLIVRKQSGENTAEVADAVEAALPEIAEASGAGLDFKIIFNQADHIHGSINNLSSTALLAVGITFLVLLIFLGSIKDALIVAAAIPLSVLATFGLMDQADMTLNMISMAGLALAIGMLVDNAIVVLENIFRLRNEGLSFKDAAIQGAGEVGMAVTASSLTTISVFVPILFVDGIAGMLFKDMAVTIVFALITSLLVALTFIPLMASRVGKKRAAKTGDEAPKQGLSDRAGAAYAGFLSWLLSHRWVVVLALVLMLAGAGVLAQRIPTDFMAETDQSSVQLTIEAPAGLSLEETGARVDEVLARVRQVLPEEEYKLIAETTGAGQGIAAVFSGGASTSSVRIPLVKIKERAHSQAEIEELLRSALSSIPGVDVKVGNPMNAFGGEGDLEVFIYGHDLSASRELTEGLAAQIEALPSVAEVSTTVEDGRPQLQINFDREKMASSGMSTYNAGRAISTLFQGKTAAQYSLEGDEIPVVVRYADEWREDIQELERMPVNSAGGVVPLANIAQVQERLGEETIRREHQERVNRVIVTLADSYVDADGLTQPKDMGQSIEDIQAIVDAQEMPEGFRASVGGTAEDFQESFMSLGIALLVAVFLVYMVMASQFESLRQPFIILFTVPLAFIGVVAAFGVLGDSVDMSALIGAIMLVGIVVNNGIVMVDAANQQREKGSDRKRAAIEAARMRLRPVLLTSATTILSMVPLAMELGEGSETWSGMAIAVIGGMLVATLLTLLVVPTMYTVFASKKQPGDPNDPKPQGLMSKAGKVVAGAVAALLLLAIPYSLQAQELPSAGAPQAAPEAPIFPQDDAADAENTQLIEVELELPQATPGTEMSLEQVLATIDERNLNLEATQIEITKAEAQLSSAWGAVLPMAQAGLTYNRADKEVTMNMDMSELLIAMGVPAENIPASEPTVIQQLNTVTGNVQASIALVDVTAWEAISLAKRSIDLSELSVEQMRQELRYQAAQAYTMALTTQTLVGLQEEQVRAAAVQLEAAKRKAQFDAGVEIDVLRAEVDLKSAYQQLADAHRAYDSARDGLALLLQHEGLVSPVESAQLPAMSEAERLDLLMASLQVELADAQIDAVWARFYPTLSAAWQGNLQITEPSGLGSTDRFTWNALLTLTIPLYDHYRYAAFDQTEAALLQAQIQEQALTAQAEFEVRDAQRDLDAAQASVINAQESEVLAGQVYELAQRSYQYGVGSSLEVSSAHQGLTAARVQVLTKELEVRLAELSLAKAQGLRI